MATGQLALCLAGLQQNRAWPEGPAAHSQTNNGLELPLAVSHPRHLYNAALLSLGGIENVSLMSHLYTGACSGDLSALATALGWWRGGTLAPRERTVHTADPHVLGGIAVPVPAAPSWRCCPDGSGTRAAPAGTGTCRPGTQLHTRWRGSHCSGFINMYFFGLQECAIKS